VWEKKEAMSTGQNTQPAAVDADMLSRQAADKIIVEMRGRNTLPLGFISITIYESITSALSAQAQELREVKAALALTHSGIDWPTQVQELERATAGLKGELEHVKALLRESISQELPRLEEVQLHAELAQTKAIKEALEIRVKDLEAVNVRDGNWLDKYGSCKVCDGEIPHGHSDNCDIYKLERRITELEAKLSAALKLTTENSIEYVKACAKGGSGRE
jgi:hypothetical protein